MTETETKRPVRVGLISLGCAKNLVDSEIMVGTLLKDGMEVINDASKADVVIVNTCSFIDAAQEESVDAILESAELRQAKNRGQGLIVSGCLPQRFREDLPKLLPEVDAFMGIDQVGRVTDIVRESLKRRNTRLESEKSNGSPAALNYKKAKISSKLAELETSAAAQHLHEHQVPASIASASPLVEVNLRPQYIPDYATPRFRLTPKHFAYLKIAEGCNHPCSFCIIPRMRGSHRSRQQSDVVAEAKALLADGVRELNLISQDSTYYGLDLRPNHSRAIAAPDKFKQAVHALPAQATTICSLLRELNDLPGDFWIRLLYTHPAHWTDELIQTIAECPKVARYVDIPLQHIHQNMLERMRRETTQEYIVDLVKRIRAGIPGIGLRTTFIVGFPGETKEYFNALLEFIREAKFERLGVFTYSQEEGTRAGNMAGQLTGKLKQQRRELAMAAQHEVAVAVAESFVGRNLKVLVEKEAGPKELNAARVSSWEHGLLRGTQETELNLKGRYFVARGEADAPDIDGRVYIRLQRGQGIVSGEFRHVKVVGHTDYDLIAELAG
ncbi:MAG TPA: 30S ribosomal protein S12 methylthiotransferase RimO [Candidatus Dormibacteraeota bacterium]|nr:30S ribosomal protein S12 methylthiotransferase RimO [Candidatus Dormibacteraeota bacterium]